ncbi:MAG: F0F1 ATP synthase subunit B [Chitinophagales bacterium]|nr:F0F1 ATP synthase subunit B [Chitinophagales bacterium]MCZ2392825.1 F0F1 ATP synthase subunit B [Chitinophagales bacterium]
MLLYDAMELITPNLGLVFWTTLCFIIFWLFVGKLAFKPIARAIKSREESIEEALSSAKKAKEEMLQLQTDNQAAIKLAQQEASQILKEARDLKSAIESNAQAKAKEEATKIVAEARAEIQKQKESALLEVKQEVSKLAVQIAEKILEKELSNSKEQQDFISDLVNKLN